MNQFWKGSINALVPGIITAAIVFGPSKVTIISKLGAEYGFGFIWIIVVAIFFMAVFTNMGARIGLATEKSILSVIRDKWGGAVATIIGFGVLFVCAAFQTGNAIGAGIAVGELTHSSSLVWTVVISALAIGLLFARKFYATLSKFMIGVVLLMLIAFVITCLLTRPSLTQLAAGFLPRTPPGAEGLVIAFVASCFSVVGAFYQAYLMQQRIKQVPAIQRKNVKDKSLTGILILGLMSAAVMICAGAVLFPRGIILQNAKDMGRALEPLFGIHASQLFLLGFLGSSVSALVGNAVLGGSIFADSMKWGSNLNQPRPKACIAFIIIAGAVFACLFGNLPLHMIVFAQGITILIVPVIGLAMLLLSSDKEIMGEHKNKPFIQVSGWFGLLLIVVLAIVNAQLIFFK